MRVNDIKNNPDIGIYSYGSKSKSGKPKAQFEVDVSKFRDPQGQKQFSGMDGTNPLVRDWVKEDPRLETVVQQARILADDLIKSKPVNDGTKTELKSVSSWLSISFADIHGKWASPAVAELVANALEADGYKVYVKHFGIGTGK